MTLSLFLISASLAGELEGIDMIGFALVFGSVIIVISVPFLIGLLFAKDLAFYQDFVKIKDVNGTRTIPYWEIQYRLPPSNLFDKTLALKDNLQMKMNIRNSGETLGIKENTCNSKTGQCLYEFLRKKTAPVLICGYQ